MRFVWIRPGEQLRSILSRNQSSCKTREHSTGGDISPFFREQRSNGAFPLPVLCLAEGRMKSPLCEESHSLQASFSQCSAASTVGLQATALHKESTHTPSPTCYTERHEGR